MMGKVVSEAFKESHRTDWKLRNPAGRDIVSTIADSLRTNARWEKAIQHLRERGELKDSVTDIGNLLKELALDTKAEEEENIKQQLFKWAWKNIVRGVSRGFPEYYKEKLIKQQFERLDEEIANG